MSCVFSESRTNAEIKRLSDALRAALVNIKF